MIAAVMVVCSHWTGVRAFWFNGGVGVQLFFVISGFLITGILLDARNRAVEQGVDLRLVVRRFYIRRFLRIFPLFYGTLALTYLAGVDAVRESIQWHALYLSNVFFALRGDWFGPVSHFWSLAVEEQFYLVWPFVILFMPRRSILPIILGCIFVAPMFRVFADAVLEAGEVAITVLPVSSFDTLGIGALFAYLHRAYLHGGGHRRIYRSKFDLAYFNVTPASLATFLGLLGVCLWVFCQVYNAHAPQWVLVDMLNRVGLVLTLLGIVYGAARGFRGIVGYILELRPLRYLGKISYGLYVFHFFVPAATSQVFEAFGLSSQDLLGTHGVLLLNGVVLVMVSAVSWHFFEKKINDLKEHYPYLPPVNDAAAVARTTQGFLRGAKVILARSLSR
jgi:peptidoglycan/LPS O-acetylase OafA/YrhL